MTTNPVEPDYLDYTYDMFLSSIDGEQSETTRFSEWIDAVERDNLYSFEAPRLGAQRPEADAVRTQGQELRLLNLSSYNYLGYGYHRRDTEAAKYALDRLAVGACTSRLQADTLEVHRRLETRLLDFMKLEGRGVSLFASGYAVNTGAISALMRKRHHI